ncbi:MAG TPA: hypothetical protein VNK91_14400 [Burkholderiaceae bacterium]|jgi:hypothetical protein|nr:hypothetical protein [Burkholderiaceae bacterium]
MIEALNVLLKLFWCAAALLVLGLVLPLWAFLIVAGALGFIVLVGVLAALGIAPAKKLDAWLAPWLGQPRR